MPARTAIKKYRMLRVFLLPRAVVFVCAFFLSCGDASSGSNVSRRSRQTKTVSVKTANVIYKSDTMQCHGFIAYDQNRNGRLPIVVIVHEWWGLTDYLKSRARQLAELGYFAIAADMYGEGRIAYNPAEAMAMAKPYYVDPYIIRNRLTAAIAKAGTFSQADTSRVAAVGYCFGGFVVLNAAKMGLPLLGAVSFHGDLTGPPPRRGAVKGEMLICQGGSDELVPEKQRLAFRKSMDSAGVKYLFLTYPDARHAFTNPEATDIGLKFHLPVAYNPTADSASWSDMKNFFSSILK